MANPKYNDDGLAIVIAKRVIGGGAAEWTWTLYRLGSTPLARAEYGFETVSAARSNARKFLTSTGLRMPIRNSAGAKENLRLTRIAHLGQVSRQHLMD